jgi:hypothetical protein
LLSAHSLSLRAANTLRPGVTGRVLASFRTVCDLATDADDVVALVGPEVGNGPLNVVLDRGPAVAVPAGARFVVADQILRVGAVEVDLSRAARWDARPDWGRLRPRWALIVAGRGGPCRKRQRGRLPAAAEGAGEVQGVGSWFPAPEARA